MRDQEWRALKKIPLKLRCQGLQNEWKEKDSGSMAVAAHAKR